MKRPIHFLILFCFCFISFELTAQEKTSIVSSEKVLTNTNTKVLEKKDGEVKKTTTPKTVLIATEKGINTYEVYNEAVRIDLFYNKEKRDMLFSLPGFVELGVSSESAPMRVVIEEQYATEYLNKYFKSH